MRDGVRWASAAFAGAFLGLLGIVMFLILASGTQAQQCGGPAGAPGAGPVGGVPFADVALFQSAAAQFSLGARGASILAAINDVESTFGTSTLPGVQSGQNSAGAAGPMQIGVGGLAGDTWDRVKVNAPSDPAGQPPNVYDEADAVYSAAHYLQLSGAPGDWPAALLAYNHAVWYVTEVLAKAQDYYTQGLQTPSPGTPAGVSASPAGVAASGLPFTVPPAAGDPAGALTLAQGQPVILAAGQLTDRTGAWGDDLTASPGSYAELTPGPARAHVKRQDATMLSGLAYMTPLQVTNPANGRSLILYKRDVASGPGASSTVNGYHFRLELTRSAQGLPATAGASVGLGVKVIVGAGPGRRRSRGR